MVPVPNNLSKVNWIEEGDKFKNLVLDKMDKTVLPGIKENVVSDFYLTPDYFEIDLATLYGSGFSIQPTFSLIPGRTVLSILSNTKFLNLSPSSIQFTLDKLFGTGTNT